MSVTITQSFKRKLADDLFSDFQDSDSTYYVGIGKSEEWNATDVPTVPTATLREERLLRESLQSIMQVSDASYVVPRTNWSTGTIYSGYDDNQVGYPTNAYFVLTAANSVYMCLRQGTNSLGAAVVSTVEPTGTNSYKAFRTSDGYIWKYLYSIGTGPANKYLAANYMPVQYIDSDTGNPIDGTGTSSEKDQYLVQQAASGGGEILGFDVDSGGSGYTGAISVIIEGDGTSSARATATVSSGSIVKVEIDDSDSGNTILHGSGYNNAKVTISGGSFTTAANIRPIIGPKEGLGADARNDLKSTSIMFNAKPTGAQGEDFIIGNDFRQICLMRNPVTYGTDSDFTSVTAGALKKFSLTSASGFANDGIITGSNTGAKAIIDYVNETGTYYLMVHQNETTGYGEFDFDGNEEITADGGGNGLLDSSTNPDINIYKGSVYLIDNRASVTRSVDQTEDLKPIISF